MQRRPTVAALAEQVNDDCERFRYFWAYGLLKETAPLWSAPEHRALLSEYALPILEAVEESLAAKEQSA
jgi:hypothetical protein